MRKAQSKRLDGKKKLVTLTKRMEDDISAFCRVKGIESESEFIRQAVASYIEREVSDETLRLRGLANVQSDVAALRDMIEVLLRYVRAMHMNLLAYHPEIEDELSEAAYKSAVFRHEQFFSVFQGSLRSDPAFFERLLHKYYTGSA